ncbi:MAG: EAL domain-containing protein [Vallitaleaceae bacterium]|nr:EAL domain-containing protein [Vallitaleaceae bacterium]
MGLKGKSGIFFFFIFFIFSALFVSEATIEHEKTEDKRVLMISSYGPSFRTFFQQIEGVKKAFEDESITLDIEFMDTKRFYTEENLNNFFRSLQYKLKQLPEYDVVLVSDDDGLLFVMEHREELFPNTPIVFFGINNAKNAKAFSQDPLITGVIEAASIGDTIEVAQQMNSKAKKVIALVDQTNSGQADKDLFLDEQKNFPELEFEVLDASFMSFDDFFTQLESYGDDTILLLLSLYKDQNGSTYTFEESLEALITHAKQPIFHPYYHGVGEGLIGGKVISHFEQGEKAAQLALRIVKGEDAKNIQLIENSPNCYVFDYEVMEQYKIDLKSIPKDSIVLNRKITFFEQYQEIVLIAIVLFLIQTLIISILSMNIQSRKRAQRELQFSKEEIEQANEELIATNEEIQQQNHKIHDLIYMDNLTGLKNRYAITQYIDEELKILKKDERFAVIFLDVDNFKNINDTFGHELGDQVINRSGRRLKAFENMNTQIARFGGDEFIITLKKKANPEEIVELIKKIQKVFKNIVRVEGHEFYLSVSIGIAVAPLNGMTQKELIQRSDMALYEAKQKGKNTYVFYNNSMNSDLENKVALQTAIREAFRKNEFFLRYQPYYDIKEDVIVGFEALIRWEKAEFFKTNPYDIIRNIEEMGIIVEIGEWILRSACIFSKKINERFGKDYCISVNVSPVQLMSMGFEKRVDFILRETGAKPENICLEVTETVLIDSIEKRSSQIERLRNKGFRIAMDDFGTGYSSLKYFKDLPVDEIKIDQSFIAQIEKSLYDRHLVEMMIHLSHQKNILVIAEGVECERQRELLQMFGCDLVQGYCRSEAIDEEDIYKILEADSQSDFVRNEGDVDA